MSTKTIDDAIHAHMAWVARFRDVLSGANIDHFDLSQTADDHACEFGRWLITRQASDAFGDTLHAKVSILHRAFHQVAGNVAAMLNQSDFSAESNAGIESAILEVDGLSAQLVDLLSQARPQSAL